MDNARDEDVAQDIDAENYDVGDEITVRLDLDAKTVAFLKNCANVGSPQSIANEPCYFAFDTSYTGTGAVTILEMK